MGNRGEALRWCGRLVHGISVRSHPSSLYGVSTLLRSCSRLLLDERAVGKSGHHFRQFGGGHSQPAMLQRNPRTPEYCHKVTREALLVHGWSTPARVKARLRLATPSRFQSHAGYATSEFQDIQQGNRLASADRENENAMPTAATERRQVVQGGGGMRMQRPPKTTREAVANLQDRLQQGFSVDSYMYADVLKRCSRERDLLSARQVHECIIKGGMDQSSYVAVNLLNVYIRCGSLQDARRVFDHLVRKEVIIWNVLIGGYARHNRPNEAMEIFNRMRSEGVQPDQISYLNILKACASPSALEWGKEIHASIRDSAFESDVRVGTAIVKMYAKCGRMEEAMQSFEKLADRDLMTWNTMIGACAESGRGADAYRLFLQMKREGFKPNEYTFMSILSAPASAGDLEWAKEVHNYVREAGIEQELHVCNALIRMYARSGSIADARVVFDGMKKRDVISWSAMIRGYAESGGGLEAYQLLQQMKGEGFKADAITCASILNASVGAGAGALDWVREVHKYAVEAGLDGDSRVGNALIHTYVKSGNIDDARQAFDRMLKRDVSSWNMMIAAYADSSWGMEAYRFFLEMKGEGFKPDWFTFVNVLNAAATAGALDWVKEIHSEALKAGLESDMRVGSSLVQMYAISGCIDEARQVFDRMRERSVMTWNIMIAGLAEHGFGHEALELFRKMSADGVKPDGISFVAVLSACYHAGLLDDGRRLFLAMTKDYGIDPAYEHYNRMVDILGRAGLLEEAKLFIDNMPVEPVGATWGALLGACRTHGNVELGEVAAKEMLKLDPKDASAYVPLAGIYAAAGEWEKVSSVRTMMQEGGVKKEPGRTWIEIDGEIHDFIAGGASHPEASAIETELNSLTEKMKAEGYIPDTQLVLQNVSEEDKELALCPHSEKLAIACGHLHTPPGQPLRVYKNFPDCPDCHTVTKFISKITGREIVSRDVSRFHHFRDGVCSCGDHW